MSARRHRYQSCQYTIDFGFDDDACNDELQSDGPIDDPRSHSIEYISFGSGSSGNSCYIGNTTEGIIVDAGIDPEIITDVLRRENIDIKRVKGLLLTHDHSDHTRYAYPLLRHNRHLRLFCTPRVLAGLLRRHSVSKRIKEYHTAIFKEIPFRLAGFEITPFDVPHDGVDNMGFSISYDNRNFVLATDLGSINDRARYYMSAANYLVIESNYDLTMLLNGHYPEFLKARIRNDNGHLDNEQTAAFLKEIVNPQLSHIFLCHLSHDNNTPPKALKASRDALESMGLRVGAATESLSDRSADIQLMALPRHEPTRRFIFRRPQNNKQQSTHV